MIPGVTIQMGGQDWMVPPLTLGQLRRLMPKVRVMTTVGAAMDEEQIATLIELVTAALIRNYPEVTEAQVENLLDLGNASHVLQAVLTGSGLRPRASGEAEAVSRGNGATSMDFSPPLVGTATQ